MNRLIAVVIIAALTLGFAVPAAYAGDTATNVALGLASFAVFNQLFGAVFHAGPAYATPAYVYQPPPQVIYVSPPPVVVVPPPPAIVVVPQPTVYYAQPVIYKVKGPKLKKWKVQY